MMKRRYLAAAALATTVVVACEDSPVVPVTGGIALEVHQVRFATAAPTATSGPAAAGPSLAPVNEPLDSGRVTVSGPTNKSVKATPGQSVTVDGLAEGTYSVLLEGWAGDQLTYTGSVTGVAVTGGQTQAVTDVLFMPMYVEFTSIGETVQLTDVPGGTNLVSGNTSIVAVSSSGLITSVANGATQINATLGSSAASSAARVAQIVKTVTVDPPTPTIDPGQTQQFTVTALDSLNQPVTSVTPLWISSNHNVATVDQSGLATGVAGGSVAISAAVLGVPGSSALTVTGASSQRPTYVQFVSQPSDHDVGDVMAAVEVEILDANGQRITSATNLVDLRVRDLPTNLQLLQDFRPILSGTTVKAAVAGVATFDDLVVDRRLGDGFSLEASIGVSFPVGGGPAPVPGSQITAVSEPFAVSMLGATVHVGAYHSCALTTTDRAVCWGRNNYGQLGGRVSGNGLDASPAWSSTMPTFVQLSAGYDHTCGLTAVPGDIYCWGANYDGQLGNTTVPTQGTALPTIVEAGSLEFIQVAAGWYHTCGLTDNDQVWCWGANYYGQIGDATYVQKPTPERVDEGVAATQAFEWVSAGAYHTCALNQAPDGRAFCWGYNGNGGLGDNTVITKNAPVALNDAIAFTTLDLGLYHSCGTTSTSSYCWGYNGYYHLGLGDTTQRLVPTAVAGLGNTGLVQELALGQYFTCARRSAPDVLCVGYNAHGQAGNGSTTHPQTSLTAVTNGHTFASIDSGAYHECAVNASGAVFCWGQGSNGQLGQGNQNQVNPSPLLVPGTGP